MALSRRRSSIRTLSLASADWTYVPWGVGAASVVALCMIVAPRIHRSLPGSLIGIVIVTVLAAVLPTPLALIGALPSTLPAPTLPDLSPSLVGALLLPAALLSVFPKGKSRIARKCCSNCDV